MKKRAKKDIVEKALRSENKIVIAQDDVWLPVPDDVFQKVIELLRATGSGSNPLRGEWRLGILPQVRDKDHAIIITSSNVQDIIRSA